MDKSTINSDIVNNHPLTKNKQIYHARISKQMKSRGSPETISSVYVLSVLNRFIFGQGVVIYFIMQLLLKKSSKKRTSFTPKGGNQLSAILFILSTATGITPLTESSNITAKAKHFLVKSSFLVCLLVNVTYHNNGGY